MVFGVKESDICREGAAAEGGTWTATPPEGRLDFLLGSLCIQQANLLLLLSTAK